MKNSTKKNLIWGAIGSLTGFATHVILSKSGEISEGENLILSAGAGYLAAEKVTPVIMDKINKEPWDDEEDEDEDFDDFFNTLEEELDDPEVPEEVPAAETKEEAPAKKTKKKEEEKKEEPAEEPAK